MKLFLYAGSIVLSIAIIIFGNFYYKGKLASIAEESAAYSATIVKADTEISSETSDEDGDKEATGLLKDLMNDHEHVKITVFGSNSNILDDNSDRSWPYLVETQLQSYQDASEITTVVIDGERSTSIEILNSEYHNEVIDSDPDLLLFEPFILNDNGNIRIEDSIDALDLMLQRLTSSLPETTIVLLPANPLPGAGFYLSQIEALETYAKEHDYLYADHWTGWPSTDDSSLEDYIENARPNEDGHQLWADSMVEFLTAE
ncbi:SGNH/GDSL hydrolase family protein [Halalkalibacter krulwichiae]|uniref:SGNH hydrolase-type esterase domain-containing protein n=1 Tax=Halalkalibacter krulwichiae TaxID=199441 RepID=A0A1X9MHX6_9BACI|nr:SGNH/GDSL hydrolase family protein [Halalkalibacter krulwichiae]ARK32220.1 hypothetical protein BkAM31D_21505 [Halalkalibacter krulwichiae]